MCQTAAEYSSKINILSYSSLYLWEPKNRNQPNYGEKQIRNKGNILLMTHVSALDYNCNYKEQYMKRTETN